MAKTITQLPAAAAPNTQYVVAADNPAGTATEKVTIGQAIAPALPASSLAGVSITYTGGLRYPLLQVEFRTPQLSTEFGGDLFYENEGPFLYVVSAPQAWQAIANGELVVTGIKACFQIAANDYYATNSTLAGISAPDLKFIASQVLGGYTTYSVFQSVSMPNLEYGNPLGQQNNFPALTTASFPKLRYGTLQFTAHAMTSFSVPMLARALTINIQANSLLSLSFPAVTIAENISVFSTQMTSLSLPLLTAITHGNFNITAPAMTTIEMPPVGQFIAFGNASGGPSISAALNKATVDAILNRFAYLDGNNGTATFGTNRTLSITGTSAAPSDLGSTTVAGSSFVCSGATCTVNWTGHGYATGDVLRISGITTATNANRYARITVVNANQFTYTITSQNATGGGTATVRKAGADVNALVTRGVTLTTN